MCHNSSVICGAIGASSCIIVSSVLRKDALRDTGSFCCLISALLHSISAASAVLKRKLVRSSVTRLIVLLRRRSIAVLSLVSQKLGFSTQASVTRLQKRFRKRHTPSKFSGIKEPP